MVVDHYKKILVRFLAVTLCVTAMFAFSFNVSFGASKATKAKHKTITVQAGFIDDSSIDRPGSVTVRLYKNGKATARIITLNSNNNWKVKVKNLKSKYKWTVKTVGAVKGYHVSKANTKKTITITCSKIYRGVVYNYIDN